MTSENNQVKVILWDWNGTLLDDVEVCIASMNAMLCSRNMPELTLDRYREVFTFPVINYYRRIGWDMDKESWDDLAMEFIGLYLKKLPQAPLHTDAFPVLDYLDGKKIRQVIISAMEQNALMDSVEQKGIGRFFEKVEGIGDHYAFSKADIASRTIRDLNVSPSSACLIGDTLHDLEVAHHISCDCILVANGHQTKERLTAMHGCVIDNLTEIQRFF
ncbi:MAG: HAD hydrolase-like protein [Bacteroidales bacterium]|nr:HAD hydrolase-like protein [Bacteroidales bacterium]